MKLKTLIYKNNLIYSAIVLFNFIWFFLGLGKAETRLMKLDQKLMSMTSSKMHYFNLNTFEAAWNHHTPPFFYILKSSYIFSEYLNIEYGIYIVYSILLLLIHFSLYAVCYKLTELKFLSLLLSTSFVFDMSSTTIAGNVIFDFRTVGILLQSLILYFSFKILEKQEKKTTVFLSLFIFFQVLVLESYIISCGIVFIYLLLNLEDKVNLFKIFISTNFLLAIISIIIFQLNSALYDLINLNYIFHFDAIGFSGTQRLGIKHLSNYGLFYHWEHNRLLHIATFFFIAIFYVFKEKLNVSERKKSFFSFIVVYFFAELIHLFLTGPRFTSYLQVILLSQYLIIFIFIYFLLLSFDVNKVILYLLNFSILFTMFFLVQFEDVVLARTSLIDKSYINAKKEVSQDSNISKFLYKTGDPELILAWVSNESWDAVYFESNKLPATRMWWWFQMKYVEKSYNWKPGRYYNTNLEEIFIKDLNRENPKFAVIEKGYTDPPDFFKEYIEKNYIYINNIDQFYIFSLKNNE